MHLLRMGASDACRKKGTVTKEEEEARITASQMLVLVCAIGTILLICFGRP